MWRGEGDESFQELVPNLGETKKSNLLKGRQEGIPRKEVKEKKGAPPKKGIIRKRVLMRRQCL
jgi:hypothetical protein